MLHAYESYFCTAGIASTANVLVQISLLRENVFDLHAADSAKFHHEYWWISTKKGNLLSNKVDLLLLAIVLHS